MFTYRTTGSPVPHGHDAAHTHAAHAHAHVVVDIDDHGIDLERGAGRPADRPARSGTGGAGSPASALRNGGRGQPRPSLDAARTRLHVTLTALSVTSVPKPCRVLGP